MTFFVSVRPVAGLAQRKQWQWIEVNGKSEQNIHCHDLR